MSRLFFNRALRILITTNGIILIAGAMLGPIYALFVSKIGGDLLDASIAGGIYYLAAGLTSIIAGKLSDKIKENELIIVFGYMTMGLGFVLYMFVSNIWMIFIVQALIGFSEAIYSPPFDALYSKHLDGHKAGLQWGAYEGMTYFVASLGAFLGGIIVTNLNFNALFVLMAVLCFASGLYIYFVPRRVL